VIGIVFCTYSEFDEALEQVYRLLALELQWLG
jgi:hypothetical protein